MNTFFLSSLTLYSFSCLSECGQRQFAVEGVCMDCDPRCGQCVGKGSTNCTSCTDTRYLHTFLLLFVASFYVGLCFTF